MKKNLLLYSLLALALSFYGCNNDDDAPVPVNPVDCKLTKTHSNGSISFEGIYDASGRLVRQNLFDLNGQPENHLDITYNSFGQVDSVKQFVKVFGRDYFIFKGVYNSSQKLSGMELYTYDLMSGSFALTNKFVYTLDADDKIVLQMGYNGSGQIESEISFEYQAGNQIKATQYHYNTGVRALYNTKTFTYENKKNPFYIWEMPYSHAAYVSPNVIKNLQVVMANGSVNAQDSYSSTFQFTANNYPLKEVRTFLSGTTHTFDYEYSCP